MKHLLFFFSISFPLACLAVPQMDSLEMAKKQFESIYEELSNIENQINSYEEWKREKDDIDLQEEDLKSAKESWRDKYRNEPKVWNVYEECFKKLRYLQKKGDEFQGKKKLQQLRDRLTQYELKLDSLLKAGQNYESRKEGDSVKLVKDETGKVWNDVEQMKAVSSEEFENEASLEKKYNGLNQKQDEISKLSEKTSPKIGDILLKIAIGLAAVAIIAGMVGSFIRGKKLRKGTDDTPTFEL